MASILQVVKIVVSKSTIVYPKVSHRLASMILSETNIPSSVDKYQRLRNKENKIS